MSFLSVGNSFFTSNQYSDSFPERRFLILFILVSCLNLRVKLAVENAPSPRAALEIKDLLQNQGYTIEGAKTKINNPEIIENSSNTSNQVVNQLKKDLEELLDLLKK